MRTARWTIAGFGALASLVTLDFSGTRHPAPVLSIGLATSAVAQPAPPRTITWKQDGAPMVLVPAGPFVYGIGAVQRDSLLRALGTPNQPIFALEAWRQVKTLPAFYIDRYEVTNGQYQKFVVATHHRRPASWKSRLLNAPNQPVVGIGWPDARAYARWAGKRLPSEEEWEKAARGTDGRFWPWGNRPSSEYYNGRAQGSFAPVAVGSFPAGASPYGAMDMAGNVYEMTTGTWQGGLRAIRGGSYLNPSAYVRTMFRWAAHDSNSGGQWLGFRCVADAH
jgi:iron(II)-dependent oxidoreductase